MAFTKKITLWYKVTPDGILPPDDTAIARKDTWLKEVTKRVEALWLPWLIEVTYRLVNPEVEQQRKFFEGPVVEYYAIQNDNQLTGDVSSTRKRQYREDILDRSLGFDVQLINRSVRKRKSTTDYTDTQQWHDFIEELRETIFEPNGYEIPDSTAFWELAKGVGYDQAKEINIRKLQERLARKDAPAGDNVAGTN